MNRKVERGSAIELAGDEFIKAIGQAMVAFAGIEGLLNLNLRSMLKNPIVWKHLANIPVSKRLDIYNDLLIQSGFPSERTKEMISSAKSLFKKRNIIAHSPMVTTGDPPEKFVMQQSTRERLTAEDITLIAIKADEVYDQVWQLFWEEKFSDHRMQDHA